MTRKRSHGNGDGDVWPRRNKEGKIIGYRGAYVGPDGKRRYVSGKTKEERLNLSFGGPGQTPIRVSFSTPRD